MSSTFTVPARPEDEGEAQHPTSGGEMMGMMVR
jgi:hypothetical protein